MPSSCSRVGGGLVEKHLQKALLPIAKSCENPGNYVHSSRVRHHAQYPTSKKESGLKNKLQQWVKSVLL